MLYAEKGDSLELINYDESLTNEDDKSDLEIAFIEFRKNTYYSLIDSIEKDDEVQIDKHLGNFISTSDCFQVVEIANELYNLKNEHALNQLYYLLSTTNNFSHKSPNFTLECNSENFRKILRETDVEITDSEKNSINVLELKNYVRNEETCKSLLQNSIKLDLKLNLNSLQLKVFLDTTKDEHKCDITNITQIIDKYASEKGFHKSSRDDLGDETNRSERSLCIII